MIQKHLSNKKFSGFVCDFMETLPKAEKGDFIVLDPPYFDLQQPTAYYSQPFSVEDQLRLISEIARLDALGCYLMFFNFESDKVEKKLSKSFTKRFTWTKMENLNSIWYNYSQV
ncbi:hypothetical protein HK096_005375, partial [Nowakowskiella sp. JEL0078]